MLSADLHVERDLSLRRLILGVSDVLIPFDENVLRGIPPFIGVRVSATSEFLRSYRE